MRARRLGSNMRHWPTKLLMVVEDIRAGYQAVFCCIINESKLSFMLRLTIQDHTLVNLTHSVGVLRFICGVCEVRLYVFAPKEQPVGWFPCRQPARLIEHVLWTICSRPQRPGEEDLPVPQILLATYALALFKQKDQPKMLHSDRMQEDLKSETIADLEFQLKLLRCCK